MDIGDKAVLLEYLKERNFFSDSDRVSIIYYPGGVSGIVALAYDDTQNIIVKQALSRLKVADVWECDPDRIITEHRAHEAYASLVPECVPTPLFADEENKVIGRVGAPDGTPMWKSQLLEGLLDFRVAGKVIDALRTIHEKSSTDAALRRDFDDNAVFYDLRISPYIEKTVAVHPRLKERSIGIIKRLMEEKMVLNHGDFSPKNILVDDATIYILDYEVAHFGHPSFDLAFFFNHFLLKAVKNKQWRDSYLNMLLYMAEKYFGGISFMDPELLEKETAELLGFMLLARVDGKSPAEYIVDDTDKKIVRNVAFGIFDTSPVTMSEVTAILKASTES